MKHTPGPWRIGLCNDDSKLQIITSDGQHLAYIEQDPIRPNAYLIAAAPDLLESLREMLPIVHDAMNADDDDVIGKIAYRASAAIAKAEGR